MFKFYLIIAIIKYHSVHSIVSSEKTLKPENEVLRHGMSFTFVEHPSYIT